MPTHPTKELPDDITIPENSFADRKMYQHMYAVVSDQENLQRLKQLLNQTIQLETLFEETEYDELIEAGLAVRNTGAGDPYIRITSLGEAFANHGPEDGLRELANGEWEAQERYISED